MSDGDMLSATSLVNKLNKHLEEAGGGAVEIRRCNRETGELLETEEKERDATMKEADFQMRTAQLARLISVLSPDEKLQWAVQRKVEGNELFEQGDLEGAVQRYMDATVGLDFGETKEQADKARSLVQVPVLTNLAACYLKLEEPEKVVRLCTEALGADPRCAKALVRRGQARIELCELRSAKQDLDAAETLAPGCAVAARRALRAAAELARRRKQVQQEFCKRMIAPRHESTGEESEAASPSAGGREPSACERGRRLCYVWRLKLARLLTFRIDPPVKFD